MSSFSVEVWGSSPPSCMSDLQSQISILVSAMPDTFYFGIMAGTGWPGVRKQCVVEIASLMGNFYHVQWCTCLSRSMCLKLSNQATDK